MADPKPDTKAAPAPAAAKPATPDPAVQAWQAAGVEDPAQAAALASATAAASKPAD